MITELDKSVQVVVEKLRQIAEHEQEIFRRQEAIRLIKEHLESDLMRTADKLNEAELLELGYLLYWHTEINTDSIARVMKLRGSSSVGKVVAGLPSGEFCAACDKEFLYDSRSQRANRLSAKRREEKLGLEYERLCDDCRQKAWENDAALRQARKEAIAQQLDAYKTMPYREYLKTEHWQEIRKSALKKSRYRCQLCNEQGILDVHHRTYERRGEEEPADVIVLCRDCHSKFHDKT